MRRNVFNVIVGLFVAMVFGMTGCGGGDETAANAGPAQNVVTGSLVTLDGSRSTGADGILITYQWSMVSKPVGSVATINNPTTVNPTFTADLPGQYSLKLIVTDTRSNTSTATVTVTASVTNAAPVANAGTAQSVVTGTLVTLDGSGSSDANGDPLTYSWAFTSRPSGSEAALSSATVTKPTFTPDIAGAYVFNLVVNDGTVNSATATAVTVTATTSVTNAAPVANAGTAQSVVTGTLVTLDGSGSSDANGDPLTYRWAFTSKPSGSEAALSSATVAKPTFTPDIAGAYVFNLVVNDGTVNSAATTVTVTTTYPPSGFPITFKGIEMESMSFTTDTIGCKASLTYKNGNINAVGTSLSFDIAVGGIIVGEKDIQHPGLQPGATVRDTFYVYAEGGYSACGTFTLQFNAAASFLF